MCIVDGEAWSLDLVKHLETFEWSNKNAEHSEFHWIKLCKYNMFKTSFDVGKGTIFFRGGGGGGSGVSASSCWMGGRSCEMQSCCESFQLLLFCEVVLVTEQMMTQQETEAGRMQEVDVS